MTSPFVRISNCSSLSGLFLFFESRSLMSSELSFCTVFRSFNPTTWPFCVAPRTISPSLSFSKSSWSLAPFILSLSPSSWMSVPFPVLFSSSSSTASSDREWSGMEGTSCGTSLVPCSRELSSSTLSLLSIAESLVEAALEVVLTVLRK